MNILVSACLLNVACRYDGLAKGNEQVQNLMKKHTLIPVCPEQLGGLPTPRPASERVGDRVMTADRNDFTDEFVKGAEEVLRLAKLYDCHYAVLKEKSPSCGKGLIYDGTFSGHLTSGNGITADLLTNHGIHIYGESQIAVLLQEIEEEGRVSEKDKA
ncbi:MAG: DUF523 domain-containing protein [Lachnospiraceae bacterium]|nr:DUF523 domain-containing protein [Lachnospiraceae bacterium]